MDTVCLLLNFGMYIFTVVGFNFFSVITFILSSYLISRFLLLLSENRSKRGCFVASDPEILINV